MISDTKRQNKIVFVSLNPIHRCLNTVDRTYTVDMTPIDSFQQFLFFDRTCGPSFRAAKGPKIGKIVKNGGSRSMIWIRNDFDRFY